MLLPLALAAFVALPAETTIDFWLDALLGPGSVALLITAVVLGVALAYTHSQLVGPLLDAVIFVGVPLCVAMTLWAFSVPGSYAFVSVSLVFVWVLLTLLWIGRFLYVLLRRRPSTGQIAAWLALPVIVGSAAAAVSLDAPLRARFELSQGAMNQVAEDVLAGRRDPRTIHRIGLWEVEGGVRGDGTFRFLVKESGLFEPAGFVYSPGGRLANLGGNAEHLSGPWYVWNDVLAD